MGRVLKELLRVSNTEGALRLHPDVTESIGDFVEKIRSNDVSSWASSMLENKGSGHSGGLPEFLLRSIYYDAEDDIYVPCILMWHIATCYCQLVQEQREQEQEANVAVAVQKDRRVATALSKYCAYLMVSAPRLLPGRTDATAKVYSKVRDTARDAVRRSSSSSSAADMLLVAMEHSEARLFLGIATGSVYFMGVELGKGLVGSIPIAGRWKVLAEFWVKALLFAAPSDDAEEHMQRLSQGGELITHLWAMLYHAGIRKWQLPTHPHIKMGWDYIFRIRSFSDGERLDNTISFSR